MPPKKGKQPVGASSSRAASRSAATSREGPTRRGSRRREEEASDQNENVSPDPIPWDFVNEEDGVRYATFGKRTILGSKYVDDDALEHVELLAEVEQLISNIGWRRFMSKKSDSFYEITREVMCSFCTNANHTHDPSENIITFQCMGVLRNLSLADIQVIMGFPEGQRWYDSVFNVNQAWYELTGQIQWKHSLAKSTYLKNPAVRYLHRVLVHTIFGRADSVGSVTRTEVFILWSMLHCKHIDGSLFFVRHLATVAGNPSGIIRVSGMITILAEYFGFDPDNDCMCTKIRGRDRIDLATMENMNMIRRHGDQFYLIGPDGYLIQKQLPHDTSIGERRDEEGTNITVDLDREPIQQTVADVLKKRRWISAGVNNQFRMETRRSAQQEVHMEMRQQGSSSSTAHPTPFFPITPLEGSTYILGVKIDKMNDRLQRFENFSSQQMALQENRRQQMEQRMDRRFDNLDSKMDLIMRHLHINTGGSSSSQAGQQFSPQTTPENTPPGSPMNPTFNPFQQSDD